MTLEERKTELALESPSRIHIYICKSMSFVGHLSVSIAVHYYLTDTGFKKRKIQLSKTTIDTVIMRRT